MFKLGIIAVLLMITSSIAVAIWVAGRPVDPVVFPQVLRVVMPEDLDR